MFVHNFATFSTLRLNSSQYNSGVEKNKHQTIHYMKEK
ncbi:hypothetical protein S2E19_04843 [Bacillus mycoides]|nr:hypothetical protein S2E19_04843 [Bacillus mycoides]